MKINIIEVPYDSGHRDYRTGAGPRYLSEGGVFDTLTKRGHQVSRLTLEASSTPTTEIATMFELYRQLSTEVRATVDAGRFPLVLAGNCNCVVGTIGGLRQDLALLFFDGHGDFNTPETTTTGFLDGMGLAMATGRCWSEMCSAIDGFSPVKEARAIQIGGRDIDPLEQKALEQSAVTWLTVDDARGEKLDTTLAWLSWEVPKPAIYLHFDMDVIDPAEARANRLAPPSGLSVDALVDIARRVRDGFEIPAVSIASVEPDVDEDGKTLAATLRLLEAIFD